MDLKPTAMRYLYLVFFLSLSMSLFAQSGLRIDTSNYYSYIRQEGGIDWLRTADAVPVIIEEIRHAGFAPERIVVGQVRRLDKTTVLVVTVAWQGDKPFGFIYESGHGLPLRKEDRNFMSDDYREPYVQLEYGPNNEVNFQKTGKLPRQVFLLRERVYWYQFDAAGTTYPVTREVAIRILRQDIRAYINHMIATGR